MMPLVARVLLFAGVFQMLEFGLGAATAPDRDAINRRDQIAAGSNCPVTVPNGQTYAASSAGGGDYGNDVLVTELALPNGIVDFRPGGPGFVLPDGAMGMKWPWWLRRNGNLTATGRRLDAAAPPMRFYHRPDYYSGIGFHASYL